MGGTGYQHLQLDLSRALEAQAGIEGALGHDIFQGRSRIGLVNNAGVLQIEPIDRLGLHRASQAFMLNALLPAWLAGLVVQRSPEAAAVRILDVSSGAATNAYAGWGTYCASKA